MLYLFFLCSCAKGRKYFVRTNSKLCFLFFLTVILIPGFISFRLNLAKAHCFFLLIACSYYAGRLTLFKKPPPFYIYSATKEITMVDAETFRQLALSFPGAIELPHFEKASFRINKKIFATLDIKNNRACVLLTETDQSVFCTFDKAIIYPVPNKWGKGGATYVELKTVRKNMLKDLLAQAYNRITPKRSSSKK